MAIIFSLWLCFEDCALSGYFTGSQLGCRWTGFFPRKTAALQCKLPQNLFITTAACWPALGGFLLSTQDLYITLLRCPGMLMCPRVWCSMCVFWLQNMLESVLLSLSFFFHPPSSSLPPAQSCWHSCSQSHHPSARLLQCPAVRGTRRERSWRKQAGRSMWEWDDWVSTQGSTWTKQGLGTLCLRATHQRSGAEGLQHQPFRAFTFYTKPYFSFPSSNLIYCAWSKEKVKQDRTAGMKHLSRCYSWGRDRTLEICCCPWVLTGHLHPDPSHHYLPFLREKERQTSRQKAREEKGRYCVLGTICLLISGLVFK